MRDIMYKTVIKDSEEEYFSGITLGKDDLVKDGGRDVKVSTFLRKYGKDGVIELLSYYDLDEEILKEYHIHLQTHAERARREKENAHKVKTEQLNKVQDCTSVSSYEEEVYETTATEVDEDDCITLEEEDYMNSVLYDSEDDPVDSSFYNPSETGWEHHPYGGVPVGTVRKPMF